MISSARHLRHRLPLVLLALSLSACVRWGEQPPEADDPSDVTGWDPPETSSSTSTSSSSSTTTDDASTGDETVWPDPWPIDPSARVVAWGRTGYPTRNLVLFENVILALGTDGGGGATTGSTTTGTAGAPTTTSGSTGGDTDSAGTSGGTSNPGDLRMLWIADCDPRTDELGCLAGNITPFFEVVDRLGTIDFLPLASVDARAYDVVVADFCGPVDPQQIAELLGDGARVLVLGDWWCASEQGPSAERANVLLERLGARFRTFEMYNHDLRVPDDIGSRLVEGVESIDAWGVALQETNENFREILVTLDGAVITTRGVEGAEG